MVSKGGLRSAQSALYQIGITRSQDDGYFQHRKSHPQQDWGWPELICHDVQKFLSPYPQEDSSYILESLVITS